jgi:hypothetical protein
LVDGEACSFFFLRHLSYPMNLDFKRMHQLKAALHLFVHQKTNHQLHVVTFIVKIASINVQKMKLNRIGRKILIVMEGKRFVMRNVLSNQLPHVIGVHTRVKDVAHCVPLVANC